MSFAHRVPPSGAPGFRLRVRCRAVRRPAARTEIGSAIRLRVCLSFVCFCFSWRGTFMPAYTLDAVSPRSFPSSRRGVNGPVVRTKSSPRAVPPVPRVIAANPRDLAAPVRVPRSVVSSPRLGTSVPGRCGECFPARVAPPFGSVKPRSQTRLARRLRLPHRERSRDPRWGLTAGSWCAVPGWRTTVVDSTADQLTANPAPEGLPREWWN